jgi:hypothetical protein
MERYRNLGGNSGVLAFEIGEHFIVIEFAPRSGARERFYRYTTRSAGAAAVHEMQRRARAGRGLATFIAQSNPGYEARWL